MISAGKDSYRLIYKLVLLNACLGAGVGWAWQQGYVTAVFAGDKTGVGYVIVALFLVGLFGVFKRAIKVSAALNGQKVGAFHDGSKFHVKAAYLGDISVWLVTLGLIGNVLGMVIAMKGLAQAGDADGAMKAIGTVIGGMEIAFMNTLLGLGLGLWSEVNLRILTTGTDLFIKDAGK